MDKRQRLDLQSTAGTLNPKLHKSQIAPVLPKTQMLNLPFPVFDPFTTDMTTLANKLLLNPFNVQDHATEQAMLNLRHCVDNESLNSQQSCEIIDHLVWSPFSFGRLKGLYPVSGFTKPDLLLKSYIFMFNIQD